MPRDDFSVQTKDLLAERVANKCSNPACRQPTSGPQDDPDKSINVGVAAHITAASEGGPRFDNTLTSAQRQAPDNGIWLCQNCAKLIDNDANRYPVDKLLEWKILSEKNAARALECKVSHLEDEFSDLEALMPKLLAEMRKDLVENPLKREFVLLQRSWIYNSKDGHELVYYYDDHPELDNMLHILQNRYLVKDITHNNVARYVIDEKFARYLNGRTLSLTVFSYSGIGKMNTPPFTNSASPFKLKYSVDWNGHFAVQVKTNSNGDLVVNGQAIREQPYETYVYGFTGTLYFHVMEAPPNGRWNLQVTTT
ncbi:hypothetical protein [Dehalogenimonas etheniformans]|uniref:HNH endonuclease n=1 Tax=Dehalogenimonas etheniformans TaxID=1536648 RepID=A0A2P5PA53_9CHLR|nr:hypothetical protein [Dehalogenimonas etheniformans]PPD59154.1 hypothetical protein JP09_000290 [Dehalogenimonas etheniformans]QNT75802.1 hypothetical protein HX448_03415 [Dehalogenimonas etheniformans]